MPRMADAGFARRTLLNAGWLLGGKGVGGLFSLVYLALAARTLGVTAFGEFALILTYAQAIGGFVQFQSWQVVIRYGAMHLAEERPDRLWRLLAFSALLDLTSAAAGALIAVAGAAVAGPLLGWSADAQARAALFGLSLVFWVRATPTGVLRLFDRFDLAAYSETVLPTMRLVGALVVAATGPSVGAFLIAWAIADLATSAAMWGASLRELRRQSLGRPTASVAGVTQENPGLWRFAWTTNFATSLNLVWQQLPTLAVGWTAGGAVAGGYRVAFQVAQALSKPAVSLARSIYPELTKLGIASGASALFPVLCRSILWAAVGGVLVLAVAAVAGEWLLVTVAGPAYAFTAPFLLLLTLAGVIEFSGFALEPAVVALGRPGTALAARVAASLLFVVLLFLLLDRYGPVGAPVAAIIASTALVLMTFVVAWRLTRAPK